MTPSGGGVPASDPSPRHALTAEGYLERRGGEEHAGRSKTHSSDIPRPRGEFKDLIRW